MRLWLTTLFKEGNASSWLIALLVLSLFIAVYQHDADPAKQVLAAPLPSNQAPSQSNEISQKLQQQIEQQATQLSFLNRRIASLEQRQDAYSKAAFDPGEDAAYQRIDTMLGPMLVILRDVEPFADGSRVTIQIGNLTSAALPGAKLHVNWASKIPVAPGEGASQEALNQFTQDLASWAQEGYSKDFDVLKSMQPGTWTIVKVNLPKITPPQLAHVGVGMTVSQVVLGSR